MLGLAPVDVRVHAVEAGDLHERRQRFGDEDLAALGPDGHVEPQRGQEGPRPGLEGDDDLRAAHVALGGAHADDRARGRRIAAGGARAGDAGVAPRLRRGESARRLDEQRCRRRVLAHAAPMASGAERQRIAEVHRVDLAVHGTEPAAERVLGEETRKGESLVAVEPADVVALLDVAAELGVDLVLVGVALEDDLQGAGAQVLDVDAGGVAELFGEDRPQLRRAIVVVDERGGRVDGRVEQAAVAAARPLADVPGLEQQHVDAALGELDRRSTTPLAPPPSTTTSQTEGSGAESSLMTRMISAGAGAAAPAGPRRQAARSPKAKT